MIRLLLTGLLMLALASGACAVIARRRAAVSGFAQDAREQATRCA